MNRQQRRQVERQAKKHPGFRNDSGLSFEDVRHLMEKNPNDFVEIQYGKFGLKVEKTLVEDGYEEIRIISAEFRALLLESVNEELAINLPKLANPNGCPDRKTCDDIMHDLVLWHCLTNSPRTNNADDFDI